jgi:hypothetical protein
MIANDPWFRALTAALFLTATHCKGNESQDKRDAGAAESAKPKSKLEQAVHAAASASAASAQGQGPPQNGVFAPGKADEEQPPGQPPKVTLVEAGADPKIKLTTDGLAPGSRFLLSVSEQTSQGPLPSLDYVLEVAAPDDEKDKANQPAKAAPTAQASATPAPKATVPGRPIAFKVRKAELGSEQPGKIPEELSKLITKIPGAKVSAVLTSSGSLADLTFDVPEAAKKGTPLVAAMTEALGYFFSPVPSDAVGVGASWIASDRAQMNGISLVRYRVTKIEKILGDKVVLQVTAKQYATGPDAVPGPKGLQALLVSSPGKAAYARTADSLVPLEGEIEVPLQLVLGQNGQPGAQLKLQLDAEVRPAPEEKKEKK